MCVELDIRPLEFIDFKQGIEHTEREIDNLSTQLQISIRVLNMLKESIKDYKEPEIAKKS